ncbi:hypothetical protein K3495_g5246 [Podosphaera aphanis]|nr:hypothetical protein K3495_g5246 [Podosphaera aphanis]
MPSFDVALIPVRQLGLVCINILFSGNKAVASKSDQIVFVAELANGLYQVSSQFQPSVNLTYAPEISLNAFTHQNPPKSLSELEHNENIQTLNQQPLSDFESRAQLWHYRLGHVGYKAIEKLGSNRIIIINKRPVTKRDKACVPCLAGNMKETFNKKTHNRTYQLARRLHADISGILPESFRSHKYFLLIIDDASRCSWLRLMKNKETNTVFVV